MTRNKHTEIWHAYSILKKYKFLLTASGELAKHKHIYNTDKKIYNTIYIYNIQTKRKYIYKLKKKRK